MVREALTAQDVADYFLSKVDLKGGDAMTPLALQKVLYYAQGFHLAMNNGQTLFPESIVAWPHGPVVRTIWLRYKDYEWRAIDPPAAYQADGLPPEQREILDAVYMTYGQLPATKLESMTHEESPWQSTVRYRVIPVPAITKYFSALVDAARKGEQIPGRPAWPINSFRFQRRGDLRKDGTPPAEAAGDRDGRDGRRK